MVRVRLGCCGVIDARVCRWTSYGDEFASWTMVAWWCTLGMSDHRTVVVASTRPARALEVATLWFFGWGVRACTVVMRLRRVTVSEGTRDRLRRLFLQSLG